MKKLLMMLGILVLSTGLTFAQDAPPPENQDPATQEQPAEQPAQDPAAETDVDVDVNNEADTAAQDDAGALPQTASPLPLIALLGLGALAGGLVARRK